MLGLFADVIEIFTCQRTLFAGQSFEQQGVQPFPRLALLVFAVELADVFAGAVVAAFCDFMFDEVLERSGIFCQMMPCDASFGPYLLGGDLVIQTEVYDGR